jgi:hypothetical protein
MQQLSLFSFVSTNVETGISGEIKSIFASDPQSANEYDDRTTAAVKSVKF